jgi:uncharacterized protein (TIGR02466 family)
MEIKSAFPVPILFHQIEKDIANKTEKFIIPRISHLKEKYDVETDYFSDRIFSLEEIPFLMKEIHKCIDYYCSELKIKVPSLQNYWVQNYNENHFHTLHNHGRCELSIVYWVRANSSSGNFKLMNPSPYNKILYHENEHSLYTTHFLQIPPIKGGLIIFPSYLEHEVLQGKKDCIRTTLALNYQ